jgi:hypothetical protein
VAPSTTGYDEEAMRNLLALSMLLAGCGAKLAEDSNNQLSVDAGSQQPIDGAINPNIDAPAGSQDAPAAAARVVYLNFTGATLTKGPSDATTNTASWLYNATTGTAPAYAGGATAIGTIVTGVTSRLNGVATVVTTRPTSGEYVMIIYGGTAANVHSFYGVAVNQLDCGDTRKNDVAWIAGNVSPTAAIDTTMGAIGFGLGLSSVNSVDDCLCSWGNNCTPSNAACVLRDGQTRDPNVTNDPNTGAAQICPGTTQDELTTFRTAFQ